MLNLVQVWFDGGSCPVWMESLMANQQKGYGSYEIDGGPHLKHKSLRQNFGAPCTGNQAEYLSLIAALKWLCRHVEPQHSSLDIWGDSQLVIYQVSNAWKTRVPHLRELRDEAQRLLKPYGRHVLHWYCRSNSVRRFGH